MKKRVLLIGTGGTIASELGKSGLKPELSGEQLLQYIPHISDICRIECRQLFSLDSSNLEPKHWLQIAAEISSSYEGFDGFVIAHGTDTMAYTAAALSYLVQGSRKPIILTGSQKPIGFETTDSKRNLRDAFTVAVSDMRGVMIVFNGKIIPGTRARKINSKSFEAFTSINYPLLGLVQDGYLLEYNRLPETPAPVFYDRLNDNVALLKLIPGASTELADYLLDRHDALIIESFGVGGLPCYESGDFYTSVKRGLENGRTVVVTTQVENEGSDLSVYHIGHVIKASLPVLEAYDMTTEAAVAKLMWILGQSRDRERIAELFYTPIARDIITKTL